MTTETSAPLNFTQLKALVTSIELSGSNIDKYSFVLTATPNNSIREISPGTPIDVKDIKSQITPLDVKDIKSRSTDNILPLLQYPKQLPRDLTNIIGEYYPQIKSDKDIKDLYALDQSGNALLRTIRTDVGHDVKLQDINQYIDVIQLPETIADFIVFKFISAVKIGLYNTAISLFLNYIIGDKQNQDVNKIIAETPSYEKLLWQLFDLAVTKEDFGNAELVMTEIQKYFPYDERDDDDNLIVRENGRGLLWWLNNGNNKQLQFLSKYIKYYLTKYNKIFDEQFVIPGAITKELDVIFRSALVKDVDNKMISELYNYFRDHFFMAYIPTIIAYGIYNNAYDNDEQDIHFAFQYQHAIDTKNENNGQFVDNFQDVIDAINIIPGVKQKVIQLLIEGGISQANIDSNFK